MTADPPRRNREADPPGRIGKGDPPRRIRKADLPRDELGRLRPPGAPDEMAHLKGLGERLEHPQEAVRRGAALFDEQRFFEAYVHFALAWKQTRAAGYRGLAQVAAGLCHVQRGNLAGARTVLERARAALRAAAPPEVAADELGASVDAVLLDLDAEAVARFPPLPRTERDPRPGTEPPRR